MRVLKNNDVICETNRHYFLDEEAIKQSEEQDDTQPGTESTKGELNIPPSEIHL